MILLISDATFGTSPYGNTHMLIYLITFIVLLVHIVIFGLGSELKPGYKVQAILNKSSEVVRAIYPHKTKYIIFK